MKTTTRRILYWTPRLLGLAFAAFISLFAMDVFGEGRGWWETLVALAMHLIPTFILLATVAVAWRWEWVGGVVFSGLAVFYVIGWWGRFHWSAYAMIAGPLLLLGLLFGINWLRRGELRMAR